MNGHRLNGYTKPTLQLSVSTNKPDQIAELMEATKKMTKYFKKSLKHTPLHSNNTNHHQNNATTPHTDNHTCKTHSQYQVNNVTSNICTSQHITTEHDDIPDNIDIDSCDCISESASGSK